MANYVFGDLFKLLMSVCVDIERRGQRLKMTRHKSPLSDKSIGKVTGWSGFLNEYICSRLTKNLNK